MEKLNLGLVQYSPEWEDKEANKQKILKLLEGQSSKIDLLIFPEMSLTGYTMRKELGEELSVEKSPSLQFFTSIAIKYSSHIFAGLIESSNQGFYNTLVHINEKGGLVKFYRKIHLFSFAREEDHYDAGKQPVITSVKGWKVGLSICYDLRFPELYRFYGKEQVHLIVNIANWPKSRIVHFRELLKSRAIENLCFVAAVNRVGFGGKEYYNGLSSVINPMGEEIISGEDKEELILIEINQTDVISTRKMFPFLNDIKLI